MLYFKNNDVNTKFVNVYELSEAPDCFIYEFYTLYY